ncbi:heterokaryon incompatibility protein-domain-containing protein [Paraphoma chrysanthemicola]|nr:heterokaryon incompatibility protein-domain-containing protein [Paraphoma chrysanthemicola]
MAMSSSKGQLPEARPHSVETCYGDGSGWAGPPLYLSRLRQTANEGCITCQIFLEGIEHFDYVPAEYGKRGVKFSEDTIRIHISMYLPDPLEMTISCPKPPGTKPAAPLILEFYSHNDDPEPIAGFATAGDVPASPSSDACFATIQQWNETCEAKHPSCRTTSEPSTLPTRLLVVGSSADDPKLCSSSSIPSKARYIALSHTWGKKEDRIKPMPVTTKENMASRRERISWDELTQTFQDAVVITRKLGLEYLWIDSLCIIQDDAEDWATEASRMASVYKNAYFVISATASHNGDDGCLKHRSPSHHLSRQDRKGSTINAYVKRQISHRSMIELPATLSTMPLFDRAWCFQERLLGRKVIHYTEDEIMWECREQLWCECRGIESGRDFSKGVHTGNFKLALAQTLASSDVYARYETWSTIVREYSMRDLTFQSDRLAALSGIASAMAVPSMGRYLAGLWEGCLLRMLCWSTTVHVVEKMWTRSRPQVYQAPTWSWASLDAAISMVVSRVYDDVEYVCRVKDVECTLATADLYGQVCDGFLALDAPTKDVSLQYQQSDVEQPARERGQCQICWDGKTKDFDEDVPLELPPSAPAPALIVLIEQSVITGSQDHGKPGYKDSVHMAYYTGIVVRASKRRQGCWERIGYVHGKFADLGATEFREVTIL